MILETYRECLRDVFDLPALVDLLTRVRSRTVRVHTVDVQKSSPFAASLLFGYVANYLYDGDAPLAERRAHALSVDQAQLAELIGEGELRTLVDPDALAALERDAQQLPEKFHARSTDAVHDLLLRLGDLSLAEIEARSAPGVAAAAIDELVARRRALPVKIAGEARLIAVEDAARYRDGLGTPLPTGLAGVAARAGARRRRRSRAPLRAHARPVHGRRGRGALGPRRGGRRRPRCSQLAETGRVVEGEFRPGGHGREWCDADVLRVVRRRSLAALRKEVEPVEPHVLGRFLVVVARADRPAPRTRRVARRGGAPAGRAARGLGARARGAAGAGRAATRRRCSTRWCRRARSRGSASSRSASAMAASRSISRTTCGCWPRRPGPTGLLDRETRILAWLIKSGASFFGPLHEAAGGGFPQETVDALWSLVWKGLVTNDTLHPLRAYTAGPRAFTPRGARPALPVAPARSAVGRGSLVGRARRSERAAPTAWAAALTQQLLTRHGVVARDVTAVEPVPGGFSTIYPVLRRLEDTGRVRRGYFVAGLGGAQFAEPGAIDLLRAERDPQQRRWP